jgi:hypothetical protein
MTRDGSTFARWAMRRMAALAEFRARRVEDALRGRRPLGGSAFRSAFPLAHGSTLPLLSESCTVGSTDDE